MTPFERLSVFGRPRPLAWMLTAMTLTATSALADGSTPPPPPPPAMTLTLGAAVSLAKARAPAVHSAFARIASAEAGVERSRSPLLPSASVQAGGVAYTTNGQVYSSGVTSGATADTYFFGAAALNLQWNLYDFGHTGSAIDAAKSGLKAATLSARATEQFAMAEAATAFFTLLSDESLVGAAEAACRDRENVVAITQRLVDAGYRTPVDATRARIAREVAELDLSVAKANRDNDSVALAAILLLDPATPLTLVPPKGNGSSIVSGVTADAAVRASREVAAASARVDQARQMVDSAKRAHLPVVAAAASGQLLYSHDRSIYPGTGILTTTGPTEVAQGALTITAPLFDSVVNAGVKAAEAKLEEAGADLEQTTQTARRDALQASRQAQNARLVLEQSERLESGTRANLTAVEERYATGLESPLTLADAQREEAMANVTVVRARLAVDLATVRLLVGLSRADELEKVQ